MSLTRTTLRIETALKIAAEKRAIDESTTLQALFNKALDEYLNKVASNMASAIVFINHDLGDPLDELNRNSYYSES